MNEFLKVIKDRRSANKFVKDISIPREDFEDIFRNLSLAPSAFNLQHANYHVIEDKEKINKVYEASYKQYKILTASATIIVTGRKDAYLDASKIYEGSRMLGIMDKTEYDIMINSINSIYEGWGQAFKHDEAIRNASLSAMMFMLLAKDKGWDTCPMIYFEKDKISDLLNLNKEEEPVLMITMGKADLSSHKVRGYRKPTDEFVKFY